MTNNNNADAILKAIAHMEAQRAVLGDETVDTAVAALRKQLTDLTPKTQPQRKQVTVLFADVSGYTAMSSTMDAEDVSELMNRLWQQLDGAIVGHYGRIDKHLGDGVMAVWGMDTAREDDPEQAILAALAMQAELADFRKRHKIDIHIRIGINTGQALLTEVGTMGEYTAIGSPVNIASRLEQAAPIDGILVSHDTYQHVRGIFDVVVQPPLQVKGVASALRTYVVNGVKRRSFRLGTRGIEGVATRMIGRRLELHQMQQALETAVAHHQRQFLTIIGDGGMGKSRLLYEFDTWVELHPQKFTYFKGRARQETQHMPYALLRDLIAFRFRIQDDDPVDVVWQKMENQLGDVLESTAAAHIVGQFLGYDFWNSPHLGVLRSNGEQLRNQALRILADYFEKISARQPTVVLLEDIHWADDSSLDAVEALAQRLHNVALFFGCAARPDLLTRRPNWGAGVPQHTQVVLRPLSQTDSYLLVAEILQRAQTVPDIIPQTIVHKAEGNPFYIEELVKMLIESGVILTEDTPWTFDLSRFEPDMLPATLTALLQARLDALPIEEKTTLQAGAVVGRIFWDDVVGVLAQRMLDDLHVPLTDVQRPLTTLMQRELIYNRDGSAFEGTREFIFKHMILRDVTYESVLKRHRRMCHQLVGEWLLAHGGARALEYAGLVADHLETAELHEEAAVYLQKAGEQAAAQFANKEAIAYFTRALRLAAERDTTRRLSLLLARARLYHLRGEREEELADLAEMSQLAKREGSLYWQAVVALRQAAYARAVGNHQETVTWAETAVQQAQADRQPALEAEGYLHWAWGLLRLGDYDEARQLLEKAYTLAQTHNLPQIEADSLRNLGFIPWQQGNYDEARLYFAQALSVHQQIGDKAGESAALNNLGLVARQQNDYQAARKYYLKSIHIKREIGDRRGEGTTLNNLGYVCWIEGDMAAARHYYEQSLQIKEEIQDKPGLATTLINLGLAAFGLGDYEAARNYYEQALAINQQIENRQTESLTLENLSLLFHYLGEQEKAHDYAQQALKLALALDARERQAFALTNLGHALAALNDYRQARMVYEQALVIRRDLRQPNLEMESLAGLARVALAEHKLAEAQTCAELIWGHLQNGTLEGTDDPYRIYLTCFRVFRALKDERAGKVLAQGYALLRAQADRIPDEVVRDVFLMQVRPHREIVQLWAEVEKEEKGVNR